MQAGNPYRQWCPDTIALAHLGDKWSLPIIRELASGPVRFVELLRRLQQISTEGLRTRLNELEADGILAKQRYNDVPPRVDYWLTEKGEDAVAVLEPLARWAWKHEWVDGVGFISIGSILRLAAAIYRPRRHLVGVTHVLAGEFEFTLILGRRSARVCNGPPQSDFSSRCTIEGSTKAWTAAVGPSGNASALFFEGDRDYGYAVLSFLRGQSA